MLLLLACGGPPAGVDDAAGSPPDGRADAASADAAPPSDGLPDAGPPDAAGPDVRPDAEIGENPFGIQLVDVTMSALGGPIYAGRTDGDSWGIGTGVGLGDLDGDGDLDLVFARIDDPDSPRPGGPSLLLLNQGGPGFPSFVADPAFSAFFPLRRAHAVALADPDEDGDLDVFMGCEGHDLYLENDGGGSFVDATSAVGLAGADDDVTMGAFFADLNRDGVLDLYVANYTAVSPPYAHPRAADRLHLGTGDGRFEDVSSVSGIDGLGATQAALAADLDGNGDLVVYAANDRFFIDGLSAFPDPDLMPFDAWSAPAGLDGAGVPTFVDLAPSRGVAAGRSSMGVALGDVDGDTTPDLYVTDWGENELYLNPTPGGPVVEAQKELRLQAREDPATGTILISWGARFLDLDRDGQLELFVVNGTVGEAFACEAWRQLDRYYRRPDASAPYQDVTALVGLPATASCDPADPAAGRGVAVGDLDGDGDDDLVVAGFVETSRVYENATPPAHHRLRVRLRGTVSSPEAIGAVLRVDTAAGTQVRHRYAGGDTHSASDPVLEVGLGAESAPLSVEVEWPSGRLQDITSTVVVDGQVTIVEPAWLTALPRVVTAAEPAPVLRYLDTPGRTVTAVRSDGVPVVVGDLGGGRYEAPLPHPGAARTTLITLTVDGVTLRPRPRVTYR